MKVAIACDHAGYDLKKEVAKIDIDWQDFGCNSEDRVDYPDHAFPAATAVASGTCRFGVLICGSGAGMVICANKVDGIRAVMCPTVEFARLARQHNDANILVLPGRFIAVSYAQQIIDTFLNTDFEGGRHTARIDKITEYENKR